MIAWPTMFTISLFLRSGMLAAGLLFCVASAAQPAQKLYEPSELVARADENRAVAAEDQETLARFRGRPDHFKDIRVLKSINFNAIHGRSITFTTPQGVDVTFSGELTVHPDGSRTWIGRTDRKVGGYLSIAINADGFYAGVALRSGSYDIVSTPKNRHYFLREVIPGRGNKDPSEPPPSATTTAASGPGGK